MDKSTILLGIQHAIDNAQSVSRPRDRDETVPTAREANVQIADLFSICLEHSQEFLTYGVKFGARVNGSRKHYRYQIPVTQASAWNTIIFEYTQLSHQAPTMGFDANQAIQDSI